MPEEEAPPGGLGEVEAWWAQERPNMAARRRNSVNNLTKDMLEELLFCDDSNGNIRSD